MVQLQHRAGPSGGSPGGSTRRAEKGRECSGKRIEGGFNEGSGESPSEPKNCWVAKRRSEEDGTAARPIQKSRVCHGQRAGHKMKIAAGMPEHPEHPQPMLPCPGLPGGVQPPPAAQLAELGSGPVCKKITAAVPAAAAAAAAVAARLLRRWRGRGG